MTELIITPNYDKKTARFKGTIAGGESVKVTIVGAAKWLSSGLRLRVVCGCAKTVAMFPLKSEDGTVSSFEVEGDDLIAAPLELNTIQARFYTQGLAVITAIFIVEDLENNILYFQDSYELHGWVKRDDDEEPYDLTKFPGLIDEWTKQIDNMEVSAKRVDNGVEIVAWDGKGEKPSAVVVLDGKKGDTGAPLTWDDLTDEQKASLKGNKGDKGDTAAHDLVPCDEDGEFYRLVAVKNENGEMVLALEQEKSGMTPSGGLDGKAVVLTTTDQTIDGVKTFAQKIKGTIEKADTATKATQDGNGKVISDAYLPLDGSKPMTSGIRVGSSNLAWRTVDNGVLAILGGSGNDKGAKLVLCGKDHSTDVGLIYLEANDGTTYVRFLVRPDGRVYTYNKDGKVTYFAKTVNNIAADSNGNIVLPLNFLSINGGTINGSLSLSSNYTHLTLQQKDVARGDIPSARQPADIIFSDKNNSRTGVVTSAVEANGDIVLQMVTYNPKQEAGAYEGAELKLIYKSTGVKQILWDNKAVAVAGDYIPSTGGSVSGPIKGTALSQSGKSLLLYTGENNFDGATIQMFERSHPTYAGRFYIRASTKATSSDATGKSCDLVGSPDGNLVWCSRCIPVIQSGTLSSGTSVTFATPFRDTNYIVLKADGSAISGITKTATGFTVSAASSFTWIAIGAL